MITCIANNGSNGQPEVPLWDCPCPTCTRLDWEALDSDRPSLGQHRHDGFPEQWDANGREIAAPECEHDDGVSGVLWASGDSEFTCNLCGVEMWATGPDPDDAWEVATPRKVAR